MDAKRPKTQAAKPTEPQAVDETAPKVEKEQARSAKRRRTHTPETPAPTTPVQEHPPRTPPRTEASFVSKKGLNKIQGCVKTYITICLDPFFYSCRAGVSPKSAAVRDWPALCKSLVFVACTPRRSQHCHVAKESFVDYFLLLGLNYDSTDQEVLRHHKLLSLRYHPDKPGG